MTKRLTTIPPNHIVCQLGQPVVQLQSRPMRLLVENKRFTFPRNVHKPINKK